MSNDSPMQSINFIVRCHCWHLVTEIEYVAFFSRLELNTAIAKSVKYICDDNISSNVMTHPIILWGSGAILPDVVHDRR